MLYHIAKLQQVAATQQFSITLESQYQASANGTLKGK